MLSVRLRAGLALIAAACLGAVTAPANAATYCVGGSPEASLCDSPPTGLQAALDAAGAHAGPDSVVLREYQNTLADGVVYSDHGQADNGVSIAGAVCDHYCSRAALSGGLPGATLLAFTGGGGAHVDVSVIDLRPGPGVTGLMLPPGGEAQVDVFGADGSIGIRAEGTAARPAAIHGGWFSQIRGGLTDIAIDAEGAATVDESHITSDIGARSRSTDGLLQIRNSQLHASVGVTGTGAKLTRSYLDLRDQSGPTLGLAAICPDSGAPDAEISATNVTVRGSGEAGSTGARAIGRGGDGDSCDATVRLNSTILNGVGTSLEVVGGAGTGADPRDGLGRIEAAYSNFDPSAIHQTEPSALTTDNPGGNVYGDPRFNPRGDDPSFGPFLSWDSPLIDRGDPAPPDSPDPWWVTTVGRRDIGANEYQFGTPCANARKLPEHPIPRGGTVQLGVDACDRDLDPLEVHWTLSNGKQLDYPYDYDTFGKPAFSRRYSRIGTFVERVTVSDPTGRSVTAQVAVRVVRQWMRHLSVVPRRMRPSALESVPNDTEIRFATRVPGPVNFRIERGILRRRTGKLRWARTRFHFKANSQPKDDTGLPLSKGLAVLRFNGWQRGHMLRPGRYRLVAKPPGARPMRVRFRMLKVHL